MKILLIFILYLISGGVADNKVTGYSGGGVLIKCKYDTGQTSNEKYFCKGPTWNCENLISTEVEDKWVNEGRFSLFDKRSSAEFWVMIRELTVEDSGTYQFTSTKHLRNGLCSTVELKIEESLHHEKCVDAVGYEGEDLNISCKYPQSLKQYPKFLCKRGASVCPYKEPVKESKKWMTIGKLSLYDNRETEIFTVRINNLTKRDSGEYWCGAELGWESDRGYKVYITQINLRVSDNKSSSTSSLFPTKNSSSTEKTANFFKTSPDPHTIPSPTCMSSRTTKPATLSTSTTTSPSSHAAGSSSSPASPVISAVSVIVVLLLIGFLVFIFALRKRRNSQDPQSTSTHPYRGPSNNHMAPVAIYEEIEESTPPPASDTRYSTIYSTAELPTNPSDLSGTFSNPIYSSAQLPDQDPPDQDIYSEAQLPFNVDNVEESG